MFNVCVSVTVLYVILHIYFLYVKGTVRSPERQTEVNWFAESHSLSLHICSEPSRRVVTASRLSSLTGMKLSTNISFPS